MTVPTSAVMIQATGSDAGKSTIVAGLARLLVRRGLRVMPFKPQNMSNNAAVAEGGGEIGRAQALQARAARVTPNVHMNPVLLKPESDTGAQVIVHGQRRGTLKAADYRGGRAQLLDAVLQSFAWLSERSDIVLVEGAGSPAEVNLRQGDIANMGFAEAANVPVVLLADIDRGGVIANVIGTHAVLDPSERARIRGFLINKFRGDARLFDGGRDAIVKATWWPSLGIVPWLPQAAWLPAEDAVSLDRVADGATPQIRIAVPMLSRIANFDDVDPLRMEPSVHLTFVRPGEPIPADVDVIIVPGTKSTMGDLAFLMQQGWDIDIKAHVRHGGHVLGLCGGYQLLGRSIADPLGTDGAPGSAPGLELLDIETVMSTDKTTRPVRGLHRASNTAIEGYEIHLGASEGPDCARPMLTIDGRPDGATSPDGRVQGTYVHGLFASDAFRRAWLASFGAASSIAYDSRIEQALDALADHLEGHVDVEAVIAIARGRSTEV
jgi:adenosylcobyric acid synthase